MLDFTQNDDKYCQIKLANKTFSSKVWRYPTCEEFMKMSGWVVEDDHVRLRDESHVAIVTSSLTHPIDLSASRNRHVKTMIELPDDDNKLGLELPCLPALLLAANLKEQLAEQYGLGQT